MSDIEWRNPLLSLRAPEWVLAMYAFLLHFVWEMLQTPLFAEMPTMAHWPATLFCLRATVGDVAIAVVAFGTVAALDGRRGWFLDPSRRSIVTYLACGVLLTIVLELHAVFWARRWSYSDLMPVIPALGVGLVPILQWIALPLATLFLLQRHHLGVPAEQRAK